MEQFTLITFPKLGLADATEHSSLLWQKDFLDANVIANSSPMHDLGATTEDALQIQCDGKEIVISNGHMNHASQFQLDSQRTVGLVLPPTLSIPAFIYLWNGSQ